MKTGPFKMKSSMAKLMKNSPAKKDKKGMSVMDFDDTAPHEKQHIAANAAFGAMMGAYNLKQKDVDLTKKKGLGPRAK